MEARLFSAKLLGVLRLAAAFPIPAGLTCVGEGPGRQQAAALRGRLRREMKIDFAGSPSEYWGSPFPVSEN